MDPDDLQCAWRTEGAQPRVSINIDAMREEFERSQPQFRSIIFWRDFREVVVALLMIPYWIYQGLALSLPWTWYLTIPACLFVAGFILRDRRRHPQRPIESGEPLLLSVRESLRQVEHQIWLLRNVFWWYLLPFSISLMAFFTHTTWLSTGGLSGLWVFLPMWLLLTTFLFVVYAGIYDLNQYAVRNDLEPRRRKLLTLLSSLDESQPIPEEHTDTDKATVYIVLYLWQSVLALFNRPAATDTAQSSPTSLADRPLFPDESAGADNATVDIGTVDIVPPLSSDSRLAPEANSSRRIGVALLVVLLVAGLSFIQLVRSGYFHPPAPPRYTNFAEAARDGLTAFDRADYDRALAAWELAVRFDPQHSEARRWRGDAYLNKRMYDQALSEYDAAIRLDPKNALAYCSRGVALTMKRETGPALAAFDEAIRLDPKVANTPFYQRYRKTADSFRQSTSATPDATGSRGK
jgi:tetratricopeptide (TPR) repeat protein